MFAKPAAGSRQHEGEPGRGRGVRFGALAEPRARAPEMFGELPVVCLAEEIETPGEGQIRAILTIAGNPALSTPDSERLDRALGTLDFMVSVDIYLNETTRHADVILPVPAARAEPLRPGVHQLADPQRRQLLAAGGRPREGALAEWEILLRLAGIGGGARRRRRRARRLRDRRPRAEGGADTGLDRRGPRRRRAPGELDPAADPERILDFMLRTGPYGDGFGADPERAVAWPGSRRHRTASTSARSSRGSPRCCARRAGKIELAAEPIVADVARLRDALGRDSNGSMVLVGRRDLRSNNSWMHNLAVLVKGKERCTLHVHPDDARTGWRDGGTAWCARGRARSRCRSR